MVVEVLPNLLSTLVSGGVFLVNAINIVFHIESFLSDKYYCSIKLAIYFQIDVKIREFSPVLFSRSV